MKIFIKALLCAIAIIFSVAGTSQAAPLKDSCTLARALVSNDLKTQNAVLNQLIGHWVPQTREQLNKQLNDNVLMKTKFAGARVFSTYSLADDISEHLLVLRRDKGSVVILVLHYVWYPNAQRLEALYVGSPGMLQASAPNAKMLQCN